jgi:hypothetical protein
MSSNIFWWDSLKSKTGPAIQYSEWWCNWRARNSLKSLRTTVWTFFVSFDGFLDLRLFRALWVRSVPLYWMPGAVLDLKLSHRKIFDVVLIPTIETFWVPVQEAFVNGSWSFFSPEESESGEDRSRNV